MRQVETIIVGGGISGATALHRLASAGRDVLLLEREEHLGGMIASGRNEHGALIEQGPNSLQTGNDDLEQLIEELGLSSEIVEAGRAAVNRYVLRDGKLIPVPTNPRGLIETPLLSARAKLRLLRERFVKPAPLEREESVAEFVRRRLGREPLDYGVNPFVAGVYAGRPEDLSLSHAFPVLHELEQKYGSLIRGAMRRAKERNQGANAPGDRPKKRRMFSFREGIGALPRAVEERWGDRILTGAGARRIDRDGAGWRLTVRVKGVEETFHARNLIVATNAIVAADLLDRIDPDLARALRRIDYPPVAVVSLLYDRSAVSHPLNGFGLLCPEVEERKVLGVIFSSTIFPTRVSSGDVLLTVFVGGARHPELALMPRQEIERNVRGELTELLGARGEPKSIDVNVETNAIPQYNLGYGEILDTIAAAEKRHSGLHLLGNYRGGISVPDCVRSGWKIGEDISCEK